MDDLRKARAAFDYKAWTEAHRLFSACDARKPLSADDCERSAICAYLIGEDESSAEQWARVHNDHLRAGRIERAARCVFWLTLDLFNRGDWARANGWLARGLHLLEERGIDCPEHGLLLVLASRNFLKQGELTAAADSAARATELAAQFDDPELAVFSRQGSALVKARLGRFPEAAALFDEIMVAVTVDDVSPIGVGVVYCAVIDACQSLFDISRAREWTTALGRWCAEQPDLVAFRGTCLVHRAEIMRRSGDWSHALLEAEQARAWSDTHINSFKYPAGAAYYELGEIHRLRGDFDAAEIAYRRASEHGRRPEPGLPLLQLARGKQDLAATSIRRLLSEQQGDRVRAGILPAAVHILLATRDVDAARAAAGELAEIANRFDAAALRAFSAHATGAVQLAEGDTLAALATLRQAWMLWQELRAPYEAATVRVLLGLACRQLGDHTGAELDFDAARVVFERLSATPDVARIDDLRVAKRNLGAWQLSNRELQVIELVAQGKTNRAIARELSISERTVDRHVSNILLKLELPSRSAATAYAYEHHLL
jgi:DNA-binding CsgD family transcriptional regulator